MQMKYAISNFYAHMILNDFIVRKVYGFFKTDCSKDNGDYAVSVFMESKYLAVLVTRPQTGREEGEDKKVLIIISLSINNIFYTF